MPNSQQMEEDAHGSIDTMKGLQGAALPIIGSAGSKMDKVEPFIRGVTQSLFSHERRDEGRRRELLLILLTPDDDGRWYTDNRPRSRRD